MYYINANLPNPNAAYVGADTRPRWVGTNRINPTVSNAVVMKNQDVGTNWNISGSLERTYRAGLYVKGGYRYGRAWNTVDPGSNRVRLVEQQPALGQPEPARRGLLGVLSGPPRVRGRHLHIRVAQGALDLGVGLL